jgi:hypothetical protein
VVSTGCGVVQPASNTATKAPGTSRVPALTIIKLFFIDLVPAIIPQDKTSSLCQPAHHSGSAAQLVFVFAWHVQIQRL